MKDFLLPISILILAATQLPQIQYYRARNACIDTYVHWLIVDDKSPTPEGEESFWRRNRIARAVQICNKGGY